MFTILIRKFINNILFILTKRNISKAKKNPVLCQDKIFKKILKESQKSTFGKDHNLTKNDTLQSYQKKVKVNIYEDYKPYIDKIMSAEKNVLWKGMPECITISSGTTSGHKYVPIYKKLLKAHYSSAFYAVLNFCLETKQYEILEDELFYLTGLQNFSIKGGVPFGHLGAMAKNNMPKSLVPKIYPPKNFNTSNNWDDKINKILKDIDSRRVSLFAGTPPWQVDFLKKFINIHAVKFGDKFPDFKLFIHSGCSFAPYRQQVFDLIGDRPNYYTMEMFPASEGFIAFQDQWDDDKKTVKDMLLNVNSNIFFEFLPIEENNSYSYDNRLTVKDVELNKSYALVVSVLGGFLSYHIGDNITVTHLNPIRIRFSGRSRFNINLIGEHMDYETILNIFINLKKNFNLDDFSLLPKLCKKEQGKIYYHWYFTSSDEKLHTSKIEEEIHKLCIENNAFFKSIAQSGLILPTKVTLVKVNSLIDFIKDKTSVGQNKVLKIIKSEVLQNKFETYIEEHIIL